jgi:DNA-binding transcriptional LysR family regulator
MAKLDLEWLSVFDEIYKTASVSRAAERLGIAQATASIALNKLRLHFGDRLFSRTALGMQPTPFASVIHPELRNVLTTLERTRAPRARFDPTTAAREFTVCLTDISEVVLMPTLLNRLRQVANKATIVTEKISTDSPQRLASGDVDLAVGFMPHLEAGFYQQTLFAQNFVCLAAKSHPRIGDKLTVEKFQAESHIVVTTSGTGHAIVDKTIAARGIKRNIALSTASYLGVARIVAQTELLVIVPERLGNTFASQENIKLMAPPFKLPSFAVKQHWHERFHADPGSIWLRRTFAELFADAKRGSKLSGKT